MSAFYMCFVDVQTMNDSITESSSNIIELDCQGHFTFPTFLTCFLINMINRLSVAACTHSLKMSVNHRLPDHNSWKDPIKAWKIRFSL